MTITPKRTVCVYEWVTATQPGDHPLAAGGRAMVAAAAAAFGSVRVVTEADGPIIEGEPSVRLSQLSPSDRVMVIAPDERLGEVRRRVATTGAAIPSVGDELLRIATDKVETSRRLRDAGIAGVEHRPVAKATLVSEADWLKPRDGCGCEGVRRGPAVVPEAGRWCVSPDVSHSASMSIVIAKDRTGRVAVWPECRQSIRYHSGTGELSFGGVRWAGSLPAAVESMARMIAAAGWCDFVGTIGVDYLATADGPVVVEINPRITESLAEYNRHAAAPLGDHLLGSVTEPVMWC